MARSSWNYRVMKITQGSEVTYGIHEVYYGPDGEIQLYSANPVPVFAEDKESLARELAHFQKALEKPVLTPDDFPNKPVVRFEAQEDG